MDDLDHLIQQKQAIEKAEADARLEGQRAQQSVAGRVAVDWEKSRAAMHEAIGAANRKFEAKNEPSRFRYQPIATEQHGVHALGALYHHAGQSKLSETHVTAKLTGEIALQHCGARAFGELRQALGEMNGDAWAFMLGKIFQADHALS